MAALNKPVMRVELREGAQAEYGTPMPVVIVEIDEQAHWRAREAFMFWLAAEVSRRSVAYGWGVQPGPFGLMGKGRPCRGILKLELADGTSAEAQQGVRVLQEAVAALEVDKKVRLLFQGE